MLRRFRGCKNVTINVIDLNLCTIIPKRILNLSANFEHDRVHGVRIITKKAKTTLKTGSLDLKKKKKKKSMCGL